MKLGIIFFCDANNPEVWNIIGGTVWFFTLALPRIQSTTIKNINTLLTEYVIWFFNIPDPDYMTREMFLPQGLKSGLKIVAKDWLVSQVETLVSKRGAILSKQLDLILCVIVRLVSILKKTIGINLDFTRILKEQISFDAHKDASEQIVKGYCEAIERPFRGIRLIKDPSLSGYRLLNVNPASQLAVTQAACFPDPHGRELISKDNNLSYANAKYLITAIKPESLKIKPGMEKSPMLAGVKDTFLHYSEGMYWSNNHELDIINKYYDYSIDRVYVNRQIRPLNIVILFGEIDMMSFTKCWIADLLIQDLFTHTISSANRAWARTILMVELFRKAIDLVHAGISLAFFDYKCFHIKHKKEDFDQCMCTCFDHGLELNAAIFLKG